MKFDNFNVIENFDNLGAGGSEKVAPPPLNRMKKVKSIVEETIFPQSQNEWGKHIFYCRQFGIYHYWSGWDTILKSPLWINLSTKYITFTSTKLWIQFQWSTLRALQTMFSSLYVFFRMTWEVLLDPHLSLSLSLISCLVSRYSTEIQ